MDAYRRRTPTAVHDSGKLVGKALFDLIGTAVAERGPGTQQPFTAVHVLLLVQPLNTLYEQSLQRLEEALGHCRRLTEQYNYLCIKLGRGYMSENEFEGWIGMVRGNPDALFLVIHDECDWGSATGSIAEKRLRVVEPEITNVVFLHVSATPQNLCVDSDAVPVGNIVDWETAAGGLGEYKGVQWYLAPRAPQEPPRYFKVLPYSHNDNASRVNALINEYSSGVQACRENNWRVPQDGVPEHLVPAMQALCASDFRLVLVRLSSLPDDLDPLLTLQQLGIHPDGTKQFDVAIDTSDIPFVGNCAKGKFSHFENPTVLRYPRQYEDLPRVCTHPLLLFVQYKARRGDTMPCPFVSYDLRDSNRNMPTYETSFMQEVGRAFGYGDRPVLLLTPNGFDGLQGHVKRLDTRVAKKRNMPLDSDTYVRVLSDDSTLRQLFEPSKSSMWSSLPEQHRFVLRAFPQIGKTGAFLHAVCLLRDWILQKQFPYLLQIRSPMQTLKTEFLTRRDPTSADGWDDLVQFHKMCKSTHFVQHMNVNYPTTMS
eukprot:m51a1_g6482 hypothetical protein (539) ;mRNA; f:124109-126415